MSARDGQRWQVASLVLLTTLSIVGNAILPMPSAFAVTGAVAGFILLLCVALANTFTCKLLLRASVATGATDYEQLAFAVGGSKLKVWTEVWIVLLLFGTNLGGLVQLGQGAAYTIRTEWPSAPGWLHHNGNAAILFFSLAVIFPLTMLPTMRKLEAVGACGSLVIWVVALAVVAKSCREGLPALRSGDFDAVGFSSIGDVSTAFSLFVFSYYIQPLLMPLLSEMPNEAGCRHRHQSNADAAGKAVTITILGTAGATYLLTGFFGAAMYGRADTASNLMENVWVPGAGTLLFNLGLVVYLALSMPPIFFANCYTVQKWFSRLTRGGFDRLPWWKRRFISLSAVGLPCLAAALALPDQSAAVLSLTGATGVSMLSFILPVAFHTWLYLGWAHIQRGLPPFDAAHHHPHKDPEDTHSFHSEGAAQHLSHLPPAGGVNIMRHRLGQPQGLVGAPVGLQAVVEQEQEGVGVEKPAHLCKRKQTFMYPLQPYRQKWSSKVGEFCLELALPGVVFLLGLCFSITTLVSLWQQGGCGEGEDDMCMA